MIRVLLLSSKLGDFEPIYVFLLMLLIDFLLVLNDKELSMIGFFLRISLINYSLTFEIRKVFIKMGKLCF